MIDFTAILRVYVESDSHLGRREAEARSPAGQSRWADARRHNDHAYFVMLFAQLEQHIDRQADLLVKRKQALADWRERRMWDGIKAKDIKFMRKVALLCPSGQATYNRVADLYKNLRCKIAHGDTAALPAILIPTVANELRSLASQLRL